MTGVGLRLGAMAAVAVLCGCVLGPDYERPAAPVPAEFKERAGFKLTVAEGQAEADRWWAAFADPVLDDLAGRVAVSNQTLAAAVAAYQQAQAVVDRSRANLYPTVAANASVRRSQSGRSSGRSFATSGAGAGPGGTPGTVVTVSGGSDSAQTVYQPSLAATWDLDVWGRIRRTVESDVASAEASAADLAAATLSAQAELASAYFQLRARDAEKALLETAVGAYEQSLRVVRSQFREGLVTRADVALAETQVETTRAQAIAVGLQRAELEHAIAVLTGVPPADLTLPPGSWQGEPPLVPLALPSSLLERRPDIAAVERRMAAASARIGVAEAAYLPEITLSGSFGYASTALGSLFEATNRAWSFGLALAQTLIDGGARTAEVAQARAALEQTVADYRQTVLTAFREVEDQLAAVRLLEEQAASQARAVAAAREAERIELSRYRAGTVDYTAVVVAQQAALNNERTALAIREQRFLATVGLIRALGGGWSTADLPREVGAPQPRLF